MNITRDAIINALRTTTHKQIKHKYFEHTDSRAVEDKCSGACALGAIYLELTPHKNIDLHQIGDFARKYVTPFWENTPDPDFMTIEAYITYFNDEGLTFAEIANKLERMP